MEHVSAAPFHRTQPYIDAASNRTLYRVMTPSGESLAEGIENEQLALLIANLPLTGGVEIDQLATQIAYLPELIESHKALLNQVEKNFFYCKWDFPWSININELAADPSGTFEEQYPGAPEEAAWILRCRELEYAFA